jgi:hypothetical protein
MANEMRSYYANCRRLVCSAVAKGQDDGSIRRDLDPVLTAEMLVAVTDGLGLQATPEWRSSPKGCRRTGPSWRTSAASR